LDSKLRLVRYWPLTGMWLVGGAVVPGPDWLVIGCFVA